MEEVEMGRHISADDTREFVVSFHDLQRAYRIAQLADIDPVDAMWMTISMDCRRTPAPAEEKKDE